MGILESLVDSFVRGLERGNPNGDPDRFRRLKEALLNRIRDERPPSIALIGETGVGKSTTINALFGAGSPVSDTRACTREAFSVTLDLGRSEFGHPRHLVVHDMPGVGESVAADAANLRIYETVLPTVDVVVWIVDAQARAIRFVQERLVQDIVPRVPGITDRLVVALNKADLVAPVGGWNPKANVPSREQAANIEDRVADVAEKLHEVLPDWTARVVAYSALRHYRLSSLFLEMIEAVPERRRWLLGDRMALASYEDLVDRGLLLAVRQGASR